MFKILKKLLAFVCLAFAVQASAQPPEISFLSASAVFSVNQTIADLLPKNTGGAVNPATYASVTTFAGNGQYSYADGSATSASFKIPSGMVKDAAGNLYVADFGNNVIRKITPAGVVSTFAGSGNAGRNNGNGSNAEFFSPWGLAMDQAGNLYVTESTTNTIRKISPSADVITLAGSGFIGKANGNGSSASFSSPLGIAIDGAGNVFVADSENHIIRMIKPNGDVSTFSGNGNISSGNGSGAEVSYGSPQGMVIDKYGNLFVADVYSQVIRKVTPYNVVTTFVGGVNGSVDGRGTSAGFKALGQIAADINGDLYVADNNMIRRIQPDGTVSTIAGASQAGYQDGTATQARFNTPSGLIFGNDGALYISEVTNHRIRKLSLSGYSIDKPLPAGLTFDPATGKISGTPASTAPATDYVVTARNEFGQSSAHIILEVKPTATPPTDKPSISYKTPLIYNLNVPISPLVPQNTAGAVDPNGYSLDRPLPPGLSLDPNTGVISGTPTAVSPATIYKVTASNAAGPSIASINIKVSDEVVEIPKPPDISYDSPKRLIINQPAQTLVPKNQGGEVIADSHALLKTFAGVGRASLADGPKDQAAFNIPRSVAFDAAGNMYVCDYNNAAIRKITPDGIVSTVTGVNGLGHNDGKPGIAQLQGPNAIVVDSHGNLFVADKASIRKITQDGNMTTLAGTGTEAFADGTGAAARFSGAVGITIDKNDNLYVADQNNLLIRKVTPAGVVTTLAGNQTAGGQDGAGSAASFNGPRDIVYHDNALYVADYLTIRKITMDGVVTTIAGNGDRTIKNGPAISASFGKANAIAVNSAGEIYILDTGNDVQNEGNVILRRIDKNGIVSTVTVVNEAGNQIYLAGQYSLLSDSEGTLYTTTDDNSSIQTLSFDRFTIDKPLPAGLIFDAATGNISGTPTELSASTQYTITAYNTGGSSTTKLTLSVGVSENKEASVITFPDPPVPVTWDQFFKYDPKVVSSQQQTPIILKSSNENVVRVNPDNTLQIVGVGEATITANQEGSGDYLPAAEVSKTIVVQRADPNLQLNAFTAKTTCSEDFLLSNTTLNSQSPIVYTSSNPAVAAVEQTGMIHIVGEGTVTIFANQPETALYNAAQEQQQQLVITAGIPVAGVPVKIIAPSVIYEGKTATFKADISGDIKAYEWLINDVSVDNNSSELSADVLKNNDKVSVVVTFNDKCLAPSTDEVIVTVLPAPVSIVPPNTFTPNNDGINDLWRIPALASYPNCRVSIFNRNGTQMLSSVGYSKAWDGTYRGKQLPAGTYYFVIETGDGQPKVAGSVTIIR